MKNLSLLEPLVLSLVLSFFGAFLGLAAQPFAILFGLSMTCWLLVFTCGYLGRIIELKEMEMGINQKPTKQPQPVPTSESSQAKKLAPFDEPEHDPKGVIVD